MNMNETPSAKKKESNSKSKKHQQLPNGEKRYFGEYDVPNPPVPNRAHTEMSIGDKEDR